MACLFAVKFAGDCVAGASTAVTIGAAAMEIFTWFYVMKCQVVIEFFLDQADKVGHGVWGIVFIESYHKISSRRFKFYFWQVVIVFFEASNR